MTSTDLQTSYDTIAEEYAAEYLGELARKPFDRKMLEWLIERVGSHGLICDLGCGPGHVARYLKDHSAETCGVDLSPGMVKVARRLNPDITFEQGNMTDLSNTADGSYQGIAAFYSIVHLQRSLLPKAFGELRRVLRDEGVLLLTFHIGKEQIHRDEWWGKAVSLDFLFFETAEIKSHLEQAGFELSEVIERGPYPDEYQSRRAYIFAIRS